MSEEQEVQAKLRDVGFTLLLLPWQILLRGVVLSFTWGWFIAEPFGAPAIGIAHACGLSLLYATVTIGSAKDDDKKKSTTERAVISLGTHGAALFIAWIIHLLM